MLFLDDLRKVEYLSGVLGLFFIVGGWLLNRLRVLRCFSFILFYVKEILAERLNCVMASLEGLNFGDMAELSPPATVLFIKDMLVGVDNPDHLFFRLCI